MYVCMWFHFVGSNNKNENKQKNEDIFYFIANNTVEYCSR
jgi:hypothetical protein